MSDPKDVVRRFFGTLGTGDFAAIGEFFTDDSVWQVNDVARGLPAQHGRKAIVEDFLQPIREGLFEPGDPKIEIRRLLGEGDWVVAETTGRGTLLNVGDEPVAFPVDAGPLTVAEVPGHGAVPGDPLTVPPHSWTILA